MNNTNQQINLYEQKKNKKKYWMFTILILVLLGVGYAYLQTTLNISGTTTVSSVQWDVHWSNISIDPNSVSTTPSPTSSASLSPASIAPSPSGSTLITFNIALDKPGDFYEFTVNAVNNGSLDAKIGSIVQSVSYNNSVIDLARDAPYLEYEVTYGDYFPLAENQLLAAHSSQTYRVRVAFKEDITEADLLEIAKQFEVTFGVNYVQIGDAASAINILDSIYYVGSDFLARGSALSVGGNPVTTYNTYQAAITAQSWNKPFFIRYGMNNNLISQPYLGFKMGRKVYYLNTSRDHYSEAVSTLLSAFGNANCGSYSEDGDTVYYCGDDGSLEVQIMDYLSEDSYIINIIYDLVEDKNTGLTSGYACGSCDDYSGCIDLSNQSAVSAYSALCPALGLD